MSSRAGRSAQAAPPSSNRQNEYFVPRDGIDREVITADICRYLGNDALVRPGVYESPQTGQAVQGYFITAYRNLTTAMIEDLKADSARWDQERRQQTARNSSGGTNASSGVFVQKSNSPIAQYRNSDIHQSRQYYGPTEGASFQDSSRDSYDSTPRYPGTGNGGYNGASGSYPVTAPYGTQGGYGGAPGYTTTQAPQFSPAPPQDGSYSGGAPAAFGQPGSERPYTQVNANMAIRGSEYGSNASYPQASPVAVTTMSQGRPVYVTAGASPGYPANPGSNYYPQPAASAPPQFASTPGQPVDAFYGRASPAGAQPYPSSHDQQQYDTTPTTRPSAPSSSTQTASSGSSSRHNRDSVDRHADSRHRSHRSGR